MSKVKSWCRANAMLVISLLAAVVTAFFVPPDRDYLGYYDLKTLACHRSAGEIKEEKAKKNK